MDEGKHERQAWRPLTPEEQRAIRKAYRPYEGWTHTRVVYTRPTAREVLEIYNRAHGQNPNISLKQVCEELNVNYASVRALKSRYAKQKKPKR